jgi:hypothetical protein
MKPTTICAILAAAALFPAHASFGGPGAGRGRCSFGGSPP